MHDPIKVGDYIVIKEEKLHIYTSYYHVGSFGIGEVTRVHGASFNTCLDVVFPDADNKHNFQGTTDYPYITIMYEDVQLIPRSPNWEYIKDKEKIIWQH